MLTPSTEISERFIVDNIHIYMKKMEGKIWQKILQLSVKDAMELEL
jgi:hypothetical protein